MKNMLGSADRRAILKFLVIHLAQILISKMQIHSVPSLFLVYGLTEKSKISIQSSNP